MMSTRNLILLVGLLGLTALPCRAEHDTLPGGRVALPFSKVVTPTDRDRLDPSIPGTFQPTAAGSPESALFGSVRTSSSGGHLYPQFHEGIDIAALRRSEKGVPLDEVRAVAAGVVGYVNRQPGNSNYGNYVVLLHDDPMGEVYTLYAHLSVIAPEVAAGRQVGPGSVLGLLGHTPVGTIPMARAHVHFEVGVVANARFREWFSRQRLKPDHGLFNGLNLYGVNPLDFFRSRDEAGRIDFPHLLSSVPVAFRLVLPASHALDYFRRYPALWRGAPFTGGLMVLDCSEDGVVLSGRLPTPEEMQRSDSRRAAVLMADPTVLGRNGCRLVVNERGRWRLGEKGARWLEILTY